MGLHLPNILPSIGQIDSEGSFLRSFGEAYETFACHSARLVARFYRMASRLC